MRPQPLIAVTDVEASSRWYQRLLGCKSAHGGAEYERLVANGELILQLHRFEVEHHHGPIGDPNDKPYGNGVLLWFETDDIDAAVGRAAAMQSVIARRATAIPRPGQAAPTNGKLGCAIPTATPSSSPARTGRRGSVGRQSQRSWSSWSQAGNAGVSE